MTTLEQAGGRLGPAAGLLDRERIIAAAGFNRWLVPPAALCIHLCIGMAYGFSVFWLPLSRAIGINKSVACPDMSLFQELFTTTCDWRIASLGWRRTCQSDWPYRRACQATWATCSRVIRSGWAKISKPSPRAIPISVMPAASAVRTASAVGADIATITGAPITAASAPFRSRRGW